MSLMIEGRVKPGRGRGKTIGFPTINIPVPRSIRRRQWGIYVSVVRVGDAVYPGVTHLGPPATFQLRPTCETFLLTLRRQLYGQWVQKRLVLKLRDIERFPNVRLLKKQISADVRAARKFFKL